MRVDFRLGDWVIRPRRDCIERGDEIVHIHSKPMAVLECLAAAGGEVVTRNELFDTVWPGVIVTDDALTQCVVELRKAFGDPAHDAQIIRTIARQGFCLVPPVTFLTEAEMAAGDKLGQAAAGVTGPMKPSTRASLITAAAVVLALAVYWYLSAPPEIVIVSPIPSIAVLPFADMSKEQDQEYFADGLSEELTNALARQGGLKVAARTSSFYFRGRNEDLRVIAESLGVNHVLEGSVRKEDEQLRITVQLIDASSGFHLWSETYDRELKNIFAIQEEISEAIVGALKEHLGLQLEVVLKAITTTNTEAYDAYLRGRFLVAQRTRAALESAVREFEKAIARDPDYALAHAEFAITTLLLTPTNYGGLTYTEAIARAMPHAERAFALDPSLAKAHVAAGYILWLQGSLDEALAHFRQAVEINPNYNQAGMGNLLGSHLGRYDEGFTAHSTAFYIDPLSIPAITYYVRSLIKRDRLDEADRELEKIISIYPFTYAQLRGYRMSVGGKWANAVLGNLDALLIDPESVRTQRYLARQFSILGLEKEALAIRETPSTYVLRILGRSADAVIISETSLAKDPVLRRRGGLGLTLASAGDYGRARPILEELWQRSGGQVTSSGLLKTASAAALVAIRRETGAEAEVDELVAAIGDNVRRYREAGITRDVLRFGTVDFDAGLAAYLAGEREKGLALIAKAAEDGHFILPNEAYLQTLYDDPGFALILEGQEARQARERNRFLAIVCTNNPYEAVWQPAEGTCERFAAEGGS